MVSGPGTTSLPTRAKRNQLNLHTIQHGKNAAKKFAAHSRRNAQSRKRALPIPSRKNHHADSRKPLPPVTGAPALPMSSRPPLPQVHKKKYWPNYPHPPDPTRLRSVAKHVVNTSAFIKGASEGQKSESQRTPSINTTINAAASAAANTASGSTTESKRRQVATETAKINQLAKRRNRLQALAVRARANRQKALQSHKRKVLAMQRFQPTQAKILTTSTADALLYGGSDSSTYSDEDEAVIAARGSLLNNSDRGKSHSDLLRRVFANSNVDRLRNIAFRDSGNSVNDIANAKFTTDQATTISENYSDSSTMSADEEDRTKGYTSIFIDDPSEPSDSDRDSDAPTPPRRTFKQVVDQVIRVKNASNLPKLRQQPSAAQRQSNSASKSQLSSQSHENKLTKSTSIRVPLRPPRLRNITQRVLRGKGGDDSSAIPSRALSLKVPPRPSSLRLIAQRIMNEQSPPSSFQVPPRPSHLASVANMVLDRTRNPLTMNTPIDAAESSETDARATGTISTKEAEEIALETAEDERKAELEVFAESKEHPCAPIYDGCCTPIKKLWWKLSVPVRVIILVFLFGTFVSIIIAASVAGQEFDVPSIQADANGGANVAETGQIDDGSKLADSDTISPSATGVIGAEGGTNTPSASSPASNPYILHGPSSS